MLRGLLDPKGPRTQIIGFQGPNSNNVIVFGPENPIIWVLGPLKGVLMSGFGGPSQPRLALLGSGHSLCL